MTAESDPTAVPIGGRVQALAEENGRLELEIARLRGQVEMLQERLSAQDAADEHHHVELEAARSETADARAQLKEAQVRVEEWRRQVADARERLAIADCQRERAEQERAAVIAALGRRARKHLSEDRPTS